MTKQFRAVGRSENPKGQLGMFTTNIKFRLSEKDTKFEKIFHLEFDAMSKVKF